MLIQAIVTPAMRLMDRPEGRGSEHYTTSRMAPLDLGVGLHRGIGEFATGDPGGPARGEDSPCTGYVHD
jgi:hypothetical protein